MWQPILIEQKLQENVVYHFKEYNIKYKSIVFKRKTNDLSTGEYLIPSGCHSNIEDESLDNMCKALKRQCLTDGLPIIQVGYDSNYNIIFYLDRPHFFRTIIHCVLEKSLQYGTLNSSSQENTRESSSQTCEPRKILLYNQNMCQLKSPNSVEGIDKTVSIDVVRSFVIQQHITLLLKACGYETFSPSLKETLNIFGDILTELNFDDELFTEIGITDQDVAYWSQNLLLSPFVSKSVVTQQCSEADSECSYEFNMKNFIEEKKLQVGKTHFDKNLSVCNIISLGRSSDVLKNACYLMNAFKWFEADTCIHLCDQSQYFTQQKLHLIFEHLREIDNKGPISQLHFIQGPIVRRKSNDSNITTSFHAYLSLRYAQMRRAAVMKYGESVHGEGWVSTLKAVTVACIKFELLSSVARNSLKLDVSDNQEWTVPSSGLFVMYNTARLSTLLSRFEEHVENGLYPPLPHLDDIDFGTLKEEPEWYLLFNFVSIFPETVLQAVDISEKSSVYAKIQTHKVCQLLSSLTRMLSSYYSRYHILGEPRPHLLPTMYARLYLLKAVYQVLVNGLALLGILPLSQL